MHTSTLRQCVCRYGYFAVMHVSPTISGSLLPGLYSTEHVPFKLKRLQSCMRMLVQLTGVIYTAAQTSRPVT